MVVSVAAAAILRSLRPPQARAVMHTLSEAGVGVCGCHGLMPAAARAQSRKAFSEKKHLVMVATDLAARGIHLPQVRKDEIASIRENKHDNHTRPPYQTVSEGKHLVTVDLAARGVHLP